MTKQIELFDQLKQPVALFSEPLRIVSLVPSLTELIADGFGLTERVTGVTQYCIYPAHIREQAHVVGGPKSVDVEKVKSLRPHVVIASKEENVQEQIREIERFVPVFVTDVVDFSSALEAITLLGNLLNVPEAAHKVRHKIKTVFSDYEPIQEDLSVAYLIWKDPLMTISSGTFIHEMLTFAGFTNVFESKGHRYPQITIQELEHLKPDWVMLSSEPYTFKEADQKELAERLPRSIIMPVDGEMFSWYGNRMTKAPAYFKQLCKFVV